MEAILTFLKPPMTHLGLNGNKTQIIWTTVNRLNHWSITDVSSQEINPV